MWFLPYIAGPAWLRIEIRRCFLRTLFPTHAAPSGRLGGPFAATRLPCASSDWPLRGGSAGETSSARLTRGYWPIDRARYFFEFEHHKTTSVKYRNLA